MGAGNSRMLEIGALRVEDGQVVSKYSQVLNPEESVPPFITHLTGIEPHETVGKPLFADVTSELAKLFEGAIFVAHNVSFDYSFFKAEFQRLGTTFNMDRLCTVRLSRALYPAERSHRLDEVIRRHGYAVANRHRAYDDAEVLHRFYADSLAARGAEQFYPLVNRLLQLTPKPSL
jgi:DNA polymerase-3 subunit epsilon